MYGTCTLESIVSSSRAIFNPFLAIRISSSNNYVAYVALIIIWTIPKHNIYLYIVRTFVYSNSNDTIIVLIYKGTMIYNNCTMTSIFQREYLRNSKFKNKKKYTLLKKLCYNWKAYVKLLTIANINSRKGIKNCARVSIV